MVIQVKAFDEYILIVPLVLLLKRVHFLETEFKGGTIQVGLDEYILMVLLKTFICKKGE